MPPTVLAVLVVTLLLPGLVMLVAVVVRFLLRGAPRPGDEDEPPDPRP
jgi:hypothetical protein